MSKPRREVVYGLTPQQQNASDILLRLVNMNIGKRYEGDFGVDVSSLTDSGAGSVAEGLGKLGVDPSIFKELVETGFRTDTTEAAAKAREVGREEVARSVENVLARSSQAGARYGSAAAAAAAREAVAGTAKYELGILGQTMQAAEQASQRRVLGLQLATQTVQAARSLNLDAARIQLAAKQYQQGMQYEEWKRQNPDVVTLLSLLFGKNVDTHISEGSDWIGPALTAIATIVGTAIMGSDKRLKRRVKALMGGTLRRVLKLTPVAYEWVDPSDDDGSRVGFIAQDMQEVFPEVVVKGLRGYLSIDYTHYTAILTKALQELAEEVDALKKRVKELEG